MKRPGPRQLRPGVAAVVVLVVAGFSIGLNLQRQAPPRYDGAAYAVLGWGLAHGRGYHEASHPEAPAHTHYPPGYPVALAAWFRAAGPSVEAAHGLSLALTMIAVLASWLWFRTLYPPAVALILGLALAVNWTWGRIGGAIQSEPLFLMLSALALLSERWAGRRGAGGGVALGVLLGACVLTRHVGACLVASVVIDLILRRERAASVAAALAAGAMVVPWVGWLARSRGRTQASLFSLDALPALVAHQAVFYMRRVPDQVAGPFVEIATVFARSPRLAGAATAVAAVATGVVLWGLLRCLRSPRRRIAALVPLATSPLLVAWPFTEAGRFLVPLVPSLLVGLTEGIAPVLARGRIRHPRSWAAAVVLAASLPYPAYAIATSRARAQERTHLAFDSACAWLARDAAVPGPVLTNAPADVFWQTGRPALAPPSDGLGSIARAIGRDRVAYLLVDEQPFANAPPDALARFVAESPRDVRLVWGPMRGVAVYATVPGASGEDSGP